MDLANLTFTQLPPKVVDEKKPPLLLTGEVIDDTVDDDVIVCATCCGVGSKPLPSGICDVCGAAWVGDDERDDFQTSLELLFQCQTLINDMLKERRLTNKMSIHQEKEARDLSLSLSDFLDDYHWNATL